MKIEIIRCLQDNYSYIIIDKKTQSACVIDPSQSEPIIDFFKNKKINLKYILNTHHHYDHIGGNLELKKRFNSKVVGYQGDKNRIPGIDILLKNNEIWKKEFTIFQGIQQVILLFIFLKKKNFLQVTRYFLLDVVEFLKELISKCLTH